METATDNQTKSAANWSLALGVLILLLGVVTMDRPEALGERTLRQR
jgi:uncharacterized membrane protein HdeD (DUF308 family)